MTTVSFAVCLTGAGDPVVLLGPRDELAVHVGTRPSALVPGRAAERGIDGFDTGPVLHPGRDPALRAPD